MTEAQTLSERGLLDATTVLAGWGRGLLSASEVSAWAVEELIGQDGEVDPDLTALTSAESLPELDLQELLAVRAAEETTSEEVADRRWMLAGLLILRAEPLGGEERLERLDELYANFGWPEELRWISRYNFAAAEEEAPPSAGRPNSPEDAADAAIATLEGQVGGLPR